MVGGGIGWSYDRRRQRAAHFSSAAAAWFIVGGVRPDERALKQRTRFAGVFFGFTGVSHFTCDLRWAASVEKLTVNMHAVHNFTVLVS